MTETPEKRAKSKLLELLPVFLEANKSLESLGLDDVDTAAMLLEIEEEYGINFGELYESLSKRELKKGFYDNQMTLADVLYYMVQQGKIEPITFPQK